MKKNNILKGAIAFSVLTLLTSGLVAANASTDISSTNTSNIINKAKHGISQFIGKMGQKTAKAPLTDAQKADLKIKTAAVKAALDSNNYTAWVAAETAINSNSPALKKVTADNFRAYVEKYKAREADAAAQKTKMDAINAALTNNDYASWVTAEKAVNTNAPILQKITADNFSRYADAYKLRAQADAIMKDLGLSGRGDGGFGPGMMGGGRPGNRGDK
jgi:hypothetical protein